jgi:hypothetical protein
MLGSVNRMSGWSRFSESAATKNELSMALS